MAETVENPVMPPAVAESIVQVMAGLGTLAKDNTNAHAKYKFASIDDFIKFVREQCHDAGLFIIPQEAREPELKEMKKADGKPLMMWHACFGFVLAHSSGAVYGPIYKTVMVQATGAQAAGSAQSYALKQLMRGLFLIPTGDADDPDKKGTAEVSSATSAPTDLQAVATNIRNSLLKAKDLDALNEVWEGQDIRIKEIKVASEKAYGALSAAYDKRKAEIEE